ncbi:MAG: Ada metal-binding domain-containing protein [Planctomycetota bacterium]
MKIKKRYPVLCLASAILCVSAFGQGKLPLSTDKPLPVGRINPAMVDIDGLYVDITASYSDFSNDGQFLGKLQAEAEQRIVQAGIKIYSGPVLVNTEPANIPVLKVNIETFEFGDSQQNVYRIQTSLSVGIYLAQAPSFLFKVDVWIRCATVEATSADNTPAAVADLVIKQVEAFVEDYLLANPPSGRAAGSRAKRNIPATVRRERIRPAPKQQALENNFVASKNSRVFHKPGCNSAKRILEENIVAYRSREEAINTGKRPCKRCKP